MPLQMRSPHGSYCCRAWQCLMQRLCKGYIPTAKLLFRLQDLVWAAHTLAKLYLSIMMFPCRHRMLWSYKP